MLFDINPAKVGGQGQIMALEWTDLFAYCSLIGADVEPWEARALKDMSEAYVTGMREGENPLSIMPLKRDS